MDEQEWLTTCNPETMMAWLIGRDVSETWDVSSIRAPVRKFRMYGIACCWLCNDSYREEDYQKDQFDSTIIMWAVRWGVKKMDQTSRNSPIGQWEGANEIRCDLIRHIFGNPFRKDKK